MYMLLTFLVVAGFEVEEASACVEIGRKLKYEATFLDYPINFYHLCCCITLWSVHSWAPGLVIVGHPMVSTYPGLLAWS